MPCSNCGNGSFLLVDWIENSSERILENNVRVLFMSSGDVNSGVAVIKQNADGSTRRIESSAGGGTPYFAIWGTPRIYLAIMINRPVGAAQSNRTIVLIDTEDPLLASTIVVSETLTAGITLPFLFRCPGDGSVIFSGTPGPATNERRDLGLFKAQGGTALDGAGSITYDGFITAKAFTDFFKVVRGNNDDDEVLEAERPQGVSNFTNEGGLDISSLNFGSLTVGAFETQQFRIENNGTNCFEIDSILNAPPFTVSPVISNRVLQPGDNLLLSVRFAPTSVISYRRFIEIRGPSPAELVNGDNNLKCVGTGKTPDVDFLGNRNFGKVPVLTSKPRSFNIRNTSDVTVTYSGAASAAGSPFRWNAFSGTLTSGQTSPIIQITFISPAIQEPFPPVFPRPFEQLHTQTFTFNTSPSTGANNYPLTATSCQTQPLISIDPFLLSVGLSLGDVLMGSQEAARILVRNPGNAALHYSARIVAVEPGDLSSEMAASMFRLKLSDDSDEPRERVLADLSAKPVSACGSSDTGSGRSDFFVSVIGTFPISARAILEIFDHNVLNGSALDIYRIRLRAEILPVIEGI